MLHVMRVGHWNRRRFSFLDDEDEDEAAGNARQTNVLKAAKVLNGFGTTYAYTFLDDVTAGPILSIAQSPDDDGIVLGVIGQQIWT